MIEIECMAYEQIVCSVKRLSIYGNLDFLLYYFKASFPKQNRLYLPRYFVKITNRKHNTIINFSLLLIYCFYRQVFFYRNFYFSFSLGFPFCPQKKSFFLLVAIFIYYGRINENLLVSI